MFDRQTPLLFLTCLLLIFSQSHHGNTIASDNQTKTTIIGVILDANTRVGKEVKVAMEIAALNFNTTSNQIKLSLHFRHLGPNPLLAAYAEEWRYKFNVVVAAKDLIKHNSVKAIIMGMESWDAVALVAGVGNRSQVLVISLVSTAIKPQLAPLQWPFLVQMTGNNLAEQIKCTAAIIRTFNWRKIIPVYELDSFGGDYGILSALTESLQGMGVEIEYNLAFPQLSSVYDPQKYVREEVTNLLTKQSRAFIILQCSLSLATHLLREAKQMRLVGKDSAWIMMESITSLLDSVNNSVISSMEGALGIKAYYSEESWLFQIFKRSFKKIFQSEYPEEENQENSIHALRAYDAVTALTMAIRKLSSSNRSSSSTLLLETFLSSNFTGLSGDNHFHNGVASKSSPYRIVNVVGKRYKELGFWSSEFGFSKSTENGSNDSMTIFSGSMNWPGDLQRVPKGWWMPSDVNKMRIGVPGRTSFEKFVKVYNSSSNQTEYEGFCIDVFMEVLKILEQSYPLPYEFIPFNGTYDELVEMVANKSFDAVVGDVTILEERSKIVEFTQPFAESGLTMIVTVKPEGDKAWIFLKPFTRDMWAVTTAILMYTVLIVWRLERETNPEFIGPWHSQLGNAFWFTSSTLFFAHRERVHNNYARVVVLIWLFVVLAITSSYTASLSSILTAPRLEPNVTDVEWLKKNNAIVGCDGDSFIRKYLVDVLGFKPENIKNISSEYYYPGEFKSRNITAAFLELPYEKAFFNNYCKGYTVSGTVNRLERDRFGGLGFVFRKGSPIASDVSQAILKLSENGRLKELEAESFASNPACLISQILEKNDRLDWHSFWGLYIFSVVTSTLCYMIFFTHRLYQRHPEAYNDLRKRLVVLMHYFWDKMVMAVNRSWHKLRVLVFDSRNKEVEMHKRTTSKVAQEPEVGGEEVI